MPFLFYFEHHFVANFFNVMAEAINDRCCTWR